MILFILSPFAYVYISITQTDKRTDYPGKLIAKEIQKKWDNKYKSKISFVAGDEWVAGNLSYHLKSRPDWEGNIEDNLYNFNEFKKYFCGKEFCIGNK